jgi:hypothetical protein
VVAIEEEVVMIAVEETNAHQEVNAVEKEKVGNNSEQIKAVNHVTA